MSLISFNSANAGAVIKSNEPSWFKTTPLLWTQETSLFILDLGSEVQLVETCQMSISVARSADGWVLNFKLLSPPDWWTSVAEQVNIQPQSLFLLSVSATRTGLTMGLMGRLPSAPNKQGPQPETDKNLITWWLLMNSHNKSRAFHNSVNLSLLLFVGTQSHRVHTNSNYKRVLSCYC